MAVHRLLVVTLRAVKSGRQELGAGFRSFGIFVDVRERVNEVRIAIREAGGLGAGRLGRRGYREVGGMNGVAGRGGYRGVVVLGVA